MGYLIQILKHDWPLIMSMAATGLAGFFADFLLNRFRVKPLSRFAAQKGYQFIATDKSKAAPFFENFIPVIPHRRYEVVGAVNIIQGEIAGVEFYYFEQQLSLPDGFYTPPYEIHIDFTRISTLPIRPASRAENTPLTLSTRLTEHPHSPPRSAEP